MSKRIQEISRQALDYAFEICNKSGHANLNSSVALTLAMSKQSELILRECADLFEMEYGQSLLTGNAAAKSLKKFFGVE